jgi:hypothetical protein
VGVFLFPNIHFCCRHKSINLKVFLSDNLGREGGGWRERPHGFGGEGINFTLQIYIIYIF